MTHVQDHCCIIKKKKKKVSQRHSDTGPHFFAHEPDYSSSASDITSYFNQRRSWPKRWSGGPLPFCHQIEITKGLAGRQTTLKNLLPGHLISLADQKLFTPDAWITTKKNPQTAAPHFECRLCTLSRTCWCENKLNMAPDLSVITRGVFQSLKKTLPPFKPWEREHSSCWMRVIIWRKSGAKLMWHVFPPPKKKNKKKIINLSRGFGAKGNDLMCCLMRRFDGNC